MEMATQTNMRPRRLPLPRATRFRCGDRRQEDDDRVQGMAVAQRSVRRVIQERENDGAHRERECEFAAPCDRGTAIPPSVPSTASRLHTDTICSRNVSAR